MDLGLCLHVYQGSKVKSADQFQLRVYCVYGECKLWSWISACLHIGHEPYKVTFSSEYFDQLYEWAIQLIKMYCW